jgi:tRNA threonylcarbamoyladenosine biosynthesis protein TsaB
LILAFDTCTLAGTLAVGNADRVMAEAYFETEKGHTGWLMPQIDSMLGDLGMGTADVDAVAVGVGPGTFTGVKVGVATAKAIAMGLDVPLAGIPTLDILAAGVSEEGIIMSVLDAKRGMLYVAAYRNESGLLRPLSDYACMEPDETVDAGLRFIDGPLAIVGEAPDILVEAFEAEGVTVVKAAGRHPRAGDMLPLCGLMLSEGRAGTAVSVTPMYLKKPT